MDDAAASDADRRFMAAAIRLSRRHLGLTGTNPSVATLIVADEAIVGHGVTAIGGRPHAEPQALAEAGKLARGATAYVTLEPCAHHGRTPPCAEALISGGIRRVVGAASDPDDRVSGRGYAMLREAGIEVVENVLAEEASDLLRGYLMRSMKKRPEITLKLALSSDDKIGRPELEMSITGEATWRQVHMLRAEHDAILVGIGTVLSDDPDLTCRLPGLDRRSPLRIVLDLHGRLPLPSRLALTARQVSVMVATDRHTLSAEARTGLTERGVEILAVDTVEGEVALPEMLDDLAARGVATLLVEGGAKTAASFLKEDLVDRILLFRSPAEIGPDGITSPVTPESVPSQFRQVRTGTFGRDSFGEWVRS